MHNELEHKVKIASASIFCLYLKIHNYHLNITGPDFYQYHKLLDEFYKDTWESFDTMSEQIRALDIYAPATMARLAELSVIQDNPMLPDALSMIHELLIDNDNLLQVFDEVNALAPHQIGLQNFIQGRVDAHNKWGWILRATIKS